MTPRAPAGRSDPDQRRLWIVAVVALAAGAWLLLGPSAQPACGVSLAGWAVRAGGMSVGRRLGRMLPRAKHPSLLLAARACARSPHAPIRVRCRPRPLPTRPNLRASPPAAAGAGAALSGRQRARHLHQQRLALPQLSGGCCPAQPWAQRACCGPTAVLPRALCRGPLSRKAPSSHLLYPACLGSRRPPASRWRCTARFAWRSACARAATKWWR